HFLLDVFFFFFQAEDGIRDFHVTGVQTCALPISYVVVRGEAGGTLFQGRIRVGALRLVGWLVLSALAPGAAHLKAGWRRTGLTRSEERRVGKEWRARWST